MSNDGAIRAFLAVEPPPEILKEIRAIQGRLKGFCPFDMRWINPESIHLTLKFFGNVTQEDVITISRIVEQYTPAMPPLYLDVKKLGVFPSLARPRVLWIGLEGDVAPLLTLQQNLEQGFARCGFVGEGRPFKPHLTLGRIKSPRYSGDPETFMQMNKGMEAGNFFAGGLFLIKSDLTPQGAKYAKLAWFPFHC